MKQQLTVDYPVQGHTRSGKPVKSHTRGEVTAQEKGWKIAREKYPEQDIHVTKSGRIYIGVAKGGGRWSPISGTTEKAIKIIGYGWTPKKASFTTGNDPRYETVYVASWFYDKHPVEQKLEDERTYQIKKKLKEIDEAITNLESMRGNPSKYEGSIESDKDIDNALKYWNNEKKVTMSRLDFTGLDFTEDYPVESYTKKSGVKVKTHKRGEKKQEVLEKIQHLKNLEKIHNPIIQIFEPLTQKWKSLGSSRIYKSLEEAKKEAIKRRKRIEKDNEKRELASNSGRNAYGSASIMPMRIKIGNKYYPATLQDENQYQKYKQHYEMDFILVPIVSKIISEEIIPVIKRTDSIPFSEFTQLKTDFITKDFAVFHGPIARDGPYKYEDGNGNWKTLYKTIENLSDIYSRYDYLPIRASVEIGAHHAEELGYGTNFMLNEETNMIEADLVLVNDEQFKEIIKKKSEYHVSPGYTDIVKNSVQIITGLDHIAFAFGEEIGRACTGINKKGSSCTKVKQIHHDQNQIMEVI